MNCGAWLGWQMDYLLWFQNFRDVSHHIFDNFFIYITLFGEVTIPITVICLFYWAINKKIGQFLLWSYILGFLANLFAKTTACIYRPWILDPRIHPLAQAMPAATGYSFPSGHTAGAVTIWGGLAAWFWQNKIIRYSCFAIVLLVMISRNYLGVHTPQDVIVSCILSSFVVFGAYKLLNHIESSENKNKDLIAVGVLFVCTVLLLCYVFFKPYPVHYLFGKVLYLPTEMKFEALLRSGVLFGAFTGWLLERRFISFQAETGSVLNKIIRTALGLVLLVGLHHVAKTSDFGICANITQHFIVGIFITFIYPFIMKKWFC